MQEYAAKYADLTSEDLCSIKDRSTDLILKTYKAAFPKRSKLQWLT